ncbi:MAG: hypothetical protein AAGG81_06295, partial [Chlamydiota bacterium]
MTGLIWFVQVVHYPLFLKVPEEVRPAYCNDHIQATNLVVIIPMLIELTTGIWITYQEAPSLIWIINFVLLVGIWLSTFILQVPLHNRLTVSGKGIDAKKLVRTNWVRTVLWTLRTALLFYFELSS